MSNRNVKKKSNKKKRNVKSHDKLKQCSKYNEYMTTKEQKNASLVLEVGNIDTNSTDAVNTPEDQQK